MGQKQHILISQPVQKALFPERKEKPSGILHPGTGRLTEDEFKIMKSHTTRGARILKGISTILQIIEGAKSHHEKYDGSGYPEGLPCSPYSAETHMPDGGIPRLNPS